MKPKYRNHFMSHCAAMASSIVVLASHAMAVDVDVVATQTAFNATYGVATLSANQTWTADKTYIMKDRVYVPNGITLTIEPGTRIYSSFDDQGNGVGTDDEVGALIIARGGNIMANGCAGKPIIFDAIQNLEAARGVDLPYDADAVAGPALTASDTAKWGGVIILGSASISLVDASQQPVRNDIVEGFTPLAAVNSDGDAFSDILEYGYDGLFAQNNADDSGVFRYVSIRHGGYNFTANNEINGLTLAGVGSATDIDHVEVFANEDDGVEIFGGTVNTSHMVVAFCKDDCFDIDQGHSGTHQFWFAIQNNNGDNLGEWDGVDTNVSGQSSKTDANVTASNPQIWNATFVGPGDDTTPVDGNTTNNNAIYSDDTFKGALRNSIIHDAQNALASFASDGNFGASGFQNNTIGELGDHTGTDASVLNGTIPSGFYLTLGIPNNGNTSAETSPGFTAYTREAISPFNLIQINPNPSSPNTTVTAGAPVVANYRGAFSGAGNWAAEWTKMGEAGYFGDVSLVDVVGSQTSFNPTYGVDTLSQDQCWTADKTYILKDRLYVPNGITLTIEPGTRIFCSFDDKGNGVGTDDSVGALIVSRGGKVIAEGTQCDPIIFDAIQNLEAELGTDLPYDPDAIAGPALTAADTAKWGGVILLGNASISLVDASQQPVRNDIVEGFTPLAAVNSDGDAFSDILEYGYDGLFAQDNADDSGTLRYVSIRHGGYNFTANNEINGLTLAGVGSATDIDHVEVYANEDDGVEFFGGTVSTSHMVVAFCKDDCFDIDQGHSGTHQFWFAIQNNNGDNLGEWDGVDTNVSGQSSKTDANVTASNPQIWNVTFVGPGDDATPVDGNTTNNNAIYSDDTFKGALRNSIIHDAQNALASFASDGNFGVNGFQNNTVGELGDHTGTDASVLNGTIPSGFYLTLGVPNNGNTAAETSPGFAAYTRNGSFSLTGINPIPVVPNTTVSAGAPVAANYRGAFNGDNWAACWTKVYSTGELLVDTDSDTFYDNVTSGSGLTADADDDNDGLSDVKEQKAGLDTMIADSPELVDYINDSATSAELLDIGYFGSSMDINGNAILTLDLQGSTTLGSWTFDQDINVGLPSGTKFYRFIDN